MFKVIIEGKVSKYIIRHSPTLNRGDSLEIMLNDFIKNECLSTQKDISWLKYVSFYYDPEGDLSGSWGGKLGGSSGHPTSASIMIKLNTFYLRNEKQIRNTLAHEYGHHWTILHTTITQKYNVFFTSRCLPDHYYQLRGLDDNYTYDCDLDYYHCDREVIAEDYRVLHSPMDNEAHMMSNNLGQPSQEIKDYIANLCRA